MVNKTQKEINKVCERNRRSFICGGVTIDRVVGSFAQQSAVVPFEVSNQFQTFHALTLNGSRITSFPTAAS
jgi:hypothetical protein